MPTAHRQRMIDSGHAAPHHGHAKRAVNEAGKLEAADEAKIAEKAAADEEAAKVADKATAEKRVAQSERHAAEREAKKFRRKPAAKK